MNVTTRRRFIQAASMAAAAHPGMSVFTDFNEEAVHRAHEMCAAVLDGFVGCGVTVGLNPFRHPVAVQPRDNRLPTASNAFALTLTYEGA